MHSSPSSTARKQVIPSSLAIAVSSGEGLGLQIVGDSGRECRHARAEAHGAGRVSGDQPVVFESAQQAIGDRAVNAQARGDLVDREGAACVGQHLEDADAAAEGLRGGEAAVFSGMRALPCDRGRRG